VPDMETEVTTVANGRTRTYVGLTVCRGPGRHRLLLTRPYNEAGRIVEIPISTIESVLPTGDQPDPRRN
jgi:hypothetical protein